MACIHNQAKSNQGYGHCPACAMDKVVAMLEHHELDPRQAWAALQIIREHSK